MIRKHKENIEEKIKAENWANDETIKNDRPITLKEIQTALKSIHQKVTTHTDCINNRMVSYKD